MKRKNGEIFESEDGLKFQAIETEKSYPSKCISCCFFTAEHGCVGELDITGDCQPYYDEDRPINLIFCEVPKTI